MEPKKQNHAVPETARGAGNSKTGWTDSRSFPLGPTLLIVAVFYMTFIGRSIFSPLLLSIEEDLGISHAEGGSFFLIISVGLMLSMLFSGFISRRIQHRYCIALAALLCGSALLVLTASTNLLLFQVSLFVLGAGAGLYLPSGIATITELVPSRRRGIAIAMHELGPILGFATAPLIAQLTLHFIEWRSLLSLIGAGSLLAGLVFARFGRGGRFHGIPPRLGNMSELLKNGEFRIITFFFIMAIGLEMGVYSMLPSYLEADRGLSRSLVNTIVSSSRLTSLPMVFVAGWLSDRFGYKRVIFFVALASGTVTALLGLGSGALLITAIYLQPMLISSFFPAGFTAMAGVSSPEERNLSVSLVIPISFLFGGGLVPALIGMLAERGSFSAGFTVVGAVMVLGIFLVPFLKHERR